MAKTKIGFHCLSGPTGLSQLILDGAALILSVDDVGVLLEAERLHPGIPKIARFFVPNITAEELRGSDPVSAARWYVHDSPMAEKIRLNIDALRVPNTWLQGPNEPVFKIPDPSDPTGQAQMDDLDGLRWLIQFEMARIRFLAVLGIRACAFNFSVGYPAVLTLRDILGPILPAMREHKAVFGLHGYSTIPMVADNHRTFRHEMIYNDVLVPLKFTDIPLAYTEWGRIDWKDAGITEDDYLTEFKIADTRLRAFPGNLLGVAAYTLGGNEHWEKYRLDGGLPAKFGEYFRQLATIPDTPPPVSAPTPLPAPAKLFAIGQRVRVTRRNNTSALNVRHAPVGGVIGVPKGAQPSDAEGLVKSEPVSATLGAGVIGWVDVNFDSGMDGFVSQNYLDAVVVAPPPPPPIPPVPTGVNLLFNPDMFTAGVQTLPGRNNVRFGNGWWLEMIEGREPRLDRMGDPPPATTGSEWLAIESQYRSRGNVPNTEGLPPNEHHLYLVDGGETEVVWHGFKRNGIQWWEMGQDLTLPAGVYQFSVAHYADIYFGNHDFITNETIAQEWKLNVAGQPSLPWSDGGSAPLGQNERIYFGHWRRLVRTFTHSGGDLSVSFETRSRWGVSVVGTLLKLASLVRLS